MNTAGNTPTDEAWLENRTQGTGRGFRSRESDRAVLSRLRGLAARASLLGSALLFFGCSSTSQLWISPLTEEGEPALSNTVSREKKHLVSVELRQRSFSRELYELPAFSITIENQGDEAITLLPVEVAAYSGENKVRIYEPTELADRIQKEIKREAEEYSGQQAEVFLQSDATRQDPSSAMATISAAKRTNNAAAARESLDKMLEEVGRIIAPASVEPGSSYTGIVKLYAEDIEAEAPLRLAVTIDGETYEFVFDVDKE